MTPRLWARSGRLVGVLVGIAALGGVVPAASSHAVQERDFQTISGEGSSWAFPFIDAVRVNVAQFGMTVEYNPSGSSQGRANFRNGQALFAASDIPFQFHPEDGSAPEDPVAGSFAYMPVVAGGTALMYNLKINGAQVTNLRLSGENVVKIFTGVITTWNDPAIAVDNPGLTLPARPVVPVVRTDGSGSSAQFTAWMIARHPQLWTDYCGRVGRRDNCGATSLYPVVDAMISQTGDSGIAGYVSSGYGEGAIGYVNYSYAIGNEAPVAKVLNAGGYYTEPTPENVAVSLLQAKVETDNTDPAVYLTQKLEGVYVNTDPRNYELSSYSYFILPTGIGRQVNEDQGYTLGEFMKYAMCQAQQQSAALGYSPMPINLVEASFLQIAKVPGADTASINIASCNNPTFSPDGHNRLADEAPQPKQCDRQGAYQCPDGTGGKRDVPTAVAAAPPAAPGQPGQPGQPTPNPGTPTPGGTPAGTPAGTPGGTPGGAPNAPVAPGPNGQPAGTSAETPVGQAPGAAVATPGSGVGSGAANPSGSAGAVPGATPSLAKDGSGKYVVVDAGGNEIEVDPDTGLAVGAAATGANVAGVAGAATVAGVGPVIPTVLEQRSRWGSSQTLIVLVTLLLVGAVLLPALAWRQFASPAAAVGRTTRQVPT